MAKLDKLFYISFLVSTIGGILTILSYIFPSKFNMQIYRFDIAPNAYGVLNLNGFILFLGITLIFSALAIYALKRKKR